GAEFSEIIAAANPDAFSPFLSEMSARERIITVTSLLAEQMRMCITMQMTVSRGGLPSKTAVDAIFEGTSTLSSFGDRIAFMTGFGLLSDEVKGDVRIMKDMRNKFTAHTFGHLNFDTPQIAAQCQKLTLNVPISELAQIPNPNERKFMQSAWAVYLYLITSLLLLTERQAIINRHGDEIHRNFILRVNSILSKIGLPEIDVPPEPSPDKCV